MVANDPDLMPDWTPEQKRKIYDHFQKKFTVEDMLEYIEDDDVKISSEVVMAEIEEMIRLADEQPEAGAA